MGIYYMVFAKKAKRCLDMGKIRHDKNPPLGRWESGAWWRGWMEGHDLQRSDLRWFLERWGDGDTYAIYIDESEPGSYDIRREGGYREESMP